jgi:cell division septation protein DedD
LGCSFNEALKAGYQNNVKSEQMRKVFRIAILFMIGILSGMAFLPLAAQRQSATVSAKVIANSASDSWNMAAHNSLPPGTILYTSTPDNNRQVALKIVRKLPKNLPYAMEISQAAADSLGISGTEASLRIEYSPARLPRRGQVVTDAYREVNATRPQPEKKGRVYYDNEEIPAVSATAPSQETVPPTATTGGKPVTNNKPAASSARNVKKIAPDKSKGKAGKQEPFSQPGTYNTRGIKVAVKGFGLQLHAFNESAKAVKEATNLEKKKLGKVYLQVVHAGNKPGYRVLLGAYATKDAAEKAAKELKTKQQLKAIVKPHL